MQNKYPRRKSRAEILATMLFMPLKEIHALDSLTGDAIAVLMGMRRDDDQLCIVRWQEEEITGLIPYPKTAPMPKAERLLSLYYNAMREKHPDRPWW